MGGRGNNSGAAGTSRGRYSPPRGRGRGRGNSPNTKHVVDILDENDSQWRVQERKRARRNTDGQEVSVTTDEMVTFRDLSIDDKLNRIMSKLETLDELKDSVKSLQIKVDINVSDVLEIKEDIKEFDLKMKTLEYKSIDQEARSRRNNLLFWGVPEAFTEDCEVTVLNIVRDKLGLDPDKSMVLQRVHRVGQKRSRMAFRDKLKPRPIVVCFRDSQDVDNILGNTYKLKDTDLGVSRDYPKEINDARKVLWPRYREAKRDGSKRVFLKFPAKLVINDVVVEDAFPNWMHFIRGEYSTHSTWPGSADTSEKRVLGAWGVPIPGNVRPTDEDKYHHGINASGQMTSSGNRDRGEVDERNSSNAGGDCRRKSTSDEEDDLSVTCTVGEAISDRKNLQKPTAESVQNNS